jgi:hypothetical protein
LEEPLFFFISAVKNGSYILTGGGGTLFFFIPGERKRFLLSGASLVEQFYEELFDRAS